MKPFTLSLTNGAQLSGIASLPSRTSTTPHYQPLLVGVHGGTYFSTYFDAGTSNSAIRLADTLGVPFVGINRPGYKDSTELPPVPEGSTFLQEEGKYLHRYILPKIWQEFGLTSGATTIIILAHSLGSPSSIVASALHAKEAHASYPYGGLIVSGWGTVHGRPTESARHIIENGVVDGRIAWPVDFKDGAMFGDPKLGRVPPEILGMGADLNTSMSLGEFEDGTFRWSDYWSNYAREVKVPVMYGMGEHDALWKASKEAVRDFALEFTGSPRVESGIVLGAPHCIELSYWGPGWVARCLGFAAECAAAEGRSFLRPHVVEHQIGDCSIRIRINVSASTAQQLRQRLQTPAQSTLPYEVLATNLAIHPSTTVSPPWTMENTEIRRGDFVYKDTLFVDLGPNKRHPRASTADLKDLLLPKRGSTPKDQVAHWYEAQLLHYGLARSKDKNTAKVRLTNALSAKALAVPKEIVQMETEMKKEYASALRKAKNAAKASAKDKPVEKAPAAKWKKGGGGGGSSSKTTIELEIDGVKVKIDRDTLDAAKKSTKSKESSSGASSSKKPKGAKTSSSTPKPATALKPPAKSKATSSAVPKPAAAPKSPAKSKTPSSAPRPLMTARRSKPFHPNAAARPVADPPQHVYDHTPVSFHHDVEMDDAPPSYESLGFDEDDETPSNSSSVVQISGTYFIPNKPFFPFDLALQIDHDQQKLWGRFRIESKTGVLRADNIAHITSGNAVSFGWRAEDEDDGDMRFGRGCDGHVEFDGEGWVRGHFRGVMDGEDVDFVGELVDEDGLDVAEMRYLWDEFPRKAYGR